MPLYDYSCTQCGHVFEALVLKGKEPAACPACRETTLERLLSLPAIKSEATHALAMKAAQARDRRQGNERTQAQREYERNHDD